MAERKRSRSLAEVVEFARGEFPGLTVDELLEAVSWDDCVGFCRSCGAEASGCEPDARGHVCESCGESEVFGAEEVLFLMG